MRMLGGFLIIALSLLLVSAPSFAEDKPAPGPDQENAPAEISSDVHETGWQFELAPYLWGSGVKSKIGVRNLEAESDLSFGDILGLMKLGFMSHAEARKGHWGMFNDVLFVKLGSSTEKRIGEGLKKIDVDVKGDFKQWAIEFGGFYRFGEGKLTFDALAGARYNYMGTNVDFGPLDFGYDKSWIDPFVGGRLGLRLTERQALTFRADVAGFDPGSDFTWNLVGMYRCRVGKNMELGLGYRHMDTEKESGNRSFDSVMSGPVVGIGFRF